MPQNNFCRSHCIFKHDLSLRAWKYMKRPNVISPVFANMGLQHAHVQNIYPVPIKKVHLLHTVIAKGFCGFGQHAKIQPIDYGLGQIQLDGWEQPAARKCISFFEQPWYAKFNSLLAPYSQGSALLDESRACACSRLLTNWWGEKQMGWGLRMKLMENHGLSWKSMIEKCVRFWIGQLKRFAVPWLNQKGTLSGPHFSTFLGIQCFCYIMFDHLCPYTFT